MNKTYSVHLESQPSKSYRCVVAANSLDINIDKALQHNMTIEADLTSEYNVGLIVGASGSGKSTLAREIYGESAMISVVDPDRTVIDQFDDSLSYDECADRLNSVGLTQVPCWLRPIRTLSNGQQVRAEMALRLGAENAERVLVFDEWTSVVDRNVARVMSHCLQKFARKQNRKVVAVSCHYDVLDWLNPDWVIDCNTATFTDRRLLWRQHKRNDFIQFEIAEVDKSTWRNFARYHYLSDKLPVVSKTFGMFLGDDQIGFQCFSNYVPHRDKSKPMQMHSNRTVIHPDFAGLGLGMRLINETSALMYERGYDVRAKFSSKPIYKAMSRSPLWQLLETQMKVNTIIGDNMMRKTGFREKVRTYSFKYLGASH